MSSAYDMLVIDLDGTLMGPGGSVSPANVQAVRSAREAGLEIVIATGRALVESWKPLQAIDHDGIVITAGGSMMCHASDGRTLHRHAMMPELVGEITAALLKGGHKVLLLKDPQVAGYDYLAVGEAELDPASRWWFESLPVRVRFAEHLQEDPHPQDTVRVGAVADHGELAPLAETLAEQIGDRGFLQHWGAVTETHATGSPTHLLEVFNPDVSKWTMVAAYCADRGLENGRVAAIGDGLNDVELVREAALGIAMGNADRRVIEVADRMTSDCAEDGVAEAIGNLLSGRW